MDDQTLTLRGIAPNGQTDPSNPTQQCTTMKSQHYSRSIAVSGGMGNLGKSILSVNLALALGEMGKKVALLDADSGPAKADFLCGVNPEHHLGHVIAGWKELDDILIELSPNVRLIPGGSGVSELLNLPIDSEDVIFTKMKTFEEAYDFLLIDTAAGTGNSVTGIVAAAGDVIIIATPEAASIIDAYESIKLILKAADPKTVHIVVNNVVGITDAEQVFHQIEQVTDRFLNHRVKFLGMIPQDPKLAEAVRTQQPVVTLAPNAPSSRAIRMIAKQIESQVTSEDLTSAEKARSFWERLSQG